MTTLSEDEAGLGVGLRCAMTESHLLEKPWFWTSVSDQSKRSQSRLSCPITGYACEGDLSHLCEDYGCARKGGLSPHSEENS
jgi:hypothetical protein